MSSTPPRLAMIIGSTRPQRFADKPADWLIEQAASRDDFTLDRLDLRDFDLPFFAEAATNLHAPSVDPKIRPLLIFGAFVPCGVGIGK